MDRTKLYDQWVDKVCHYLEKVGPQINCASCAFQSKPVLDKSPYVIFLGYNAHEHWGYMGVDRERFYKGNPSFYTQRDYTAWKIWNKPYKAFQWAGYLSPMTDGNFVFMNAVYFGSETIKAFQSKPYSNEIVSQCLDFTSEVIHHIFRPKCIVCFSIIDCFYLLARKYGFNDIEMVTPTIVNGEPAKHNVIKGKWGGIPVYGIPHPSGRVSNDDWGGIALYLKEEMEKLGI